MTLKDIVDHLVDGLKFGFAEYMFILPDLLLHQKDNLFVLDEFFFRKSLHQSLGNELHHVIVIPQIFKIALSGLESGGRFPSDDAFINTEISG